MFVRPQNALYPQAAGVIAVPKLFDHQVPWQSPFTDARELFRQMDREVPTYTLVVQGRFHAFALAKSLLAELSSIHR
jgi:hypothetical protein